MPRAAGKKELVEDRLVKRGTVSRGCVTQDRFTVMNCFSITAESKKFIVLQGGCVGLELILPSFVNGVAL